VLPLFKKFAALVRRCGRVTLIPQKTRAAFLARTRFVSVYPRKDGFLAGFIISRPLVHPRVVNHEFYPPHVHLNYVRIATAADLDAELLGWLRDSYRYYGQQGHLAARRRRTSD
jgi:hypothetical protein